MSSTTRTYRPVGARGSRGRKAFLLLAGFSLMACTDELPTDLDTLVIPPARAIVSTGVPTRVADLRAAPASETSVTLTWTEVDDGTGHPARYHVRYDDSPIGYGWGQATVADAGTCTDPVKGTGIGNTISCTVTGLSPSHLYDFQLVSYRPGNNWRVYGSLSNVATVRTVLQVTSPSKVEDLRAAGTTAASVTLSFTQVSDGAGGAADYEIRYANTPLGWGWGSATSPSAGGCARPVEGTAVGQALTCTIDGLQPSTSYDFQIVAFRQTATGKVYSPLSAIARGVTTAPAVQQPLGNPGVVGDLSVAATTASAATLRWTQVADGAGGGASYEVRYAATPIGWGWGSAMIVTSGACAVPVRGSAPGQPLTCTVDGLAAGLSYDFQIVSFRQTDTGRVYAGLSNVATGRTGAASGDGTGSTGGGDGGTTGDGSTGGTGTSGRFPFEPAGSTPITDRRFDAANEDGWFSSGGLSTESDASAPLSGPGVLRATFPAGFGGGYAPIWSDKAISSLGYGKVYVSFALKLSSNWQGHSTGTNKIGFVWLNDKPVLFFNAYGTGSGTLKPVVSVQNTPQGAFNFQPNVNTGVVVKRGEWQRWEAVLKVNSGSNADGEIHLWIDGVKVLELKNVNLSSGGKVWEYLTWRPIWGGAGDSVRSTQYMWMDHYYASGSR